MDGLLSRNGHRPAVATAILGENGITYEIAPLTMLELALLSRVKTNKMLLMETAVHFGVKVPAVSIAEADALALEFPNTLALLFSQIVALSGLKIE